VCVCADETGFFPQSALQPLRSSDRPCRSVLSGRRYASGDTWRVDACQSCACLDGQITCFSQTCPILSCNKSVLKKGHCCPICVSGQCADLLSSLVSKHVDDTQLHQGRWIFKCMASGINIYFVFGYPK